MLTATTRVVLGAGGRRWLFGNGITTPLGDGGARPRQGGVSATAWRRAPPLAAAGSGGGAGDGDGAGPSYPQR
jgi:hypothetical protein